MNTDDLLLPCTWATSWLFPESDGSQLVYEQRQEQGAELGVQRGVDSSAPGALGAGKCQLCSFHSHLSICQGWFSAWLVGRRGRQERPRWGEGASLDLAGRSLKIPKKALACSVPQFLQLTNRDGQGMMLIS